MSDTVLHPIIGSFEPIEDLVYHDCPHVFTFRDAQGALAIAYLSRMDEKSSQYLATPISEAELADVKAGSLALRSVFRIEAWDIRVDANATIVSVSKKPARELDPTDLPPADLKI